MTAELSPLASREQHAASGRPASLVARAIEARIPDFDKGRLRIVLPSGAMIERHGGERGADGTIVLHGWGALWRMMTAGENGFSDGYIAGEWSTPDISSLLDFFMQNETTFARQCEPNWFGRVRDRIRHWRNENTLSGSRRNICAHYDLGNAFYRQWLDKGMNYSSAIYSGDEPLEIAQERKLSRIAELLSLKGTARVLEIGCGWGALAETLVRRHGCDVVGLTLSDEQLHYARRRLQSDNTRCRADIRLQDYRDCEGRFDRVVSIEMLEAVGERYWPAYFGKVASSLTEGGVAVLQVITLQENRFASYRGRPDFIQRYIFPGGMLPTPSIVEEQAARAGLVLDHMKSFGDSYARTLREWRMRFVTAWPGIEALGFDQRFRRMWEYYLAYCEAGFRFGAIDVSLFRFVRP